MCGIAGVYFFKNKASQSFDHSEVLSSLKHRGPDNQNFLEAKNCLLYHSRLSIVDVSSCSNQPYASENAALVYNGEIFNFKEFTPQAKGDVEVLFQLLNDEKEKCLTKLNGFFAFAFLKDNRLLIARDRLGIKPLYYYRDEDKFVFASELKALLTIARKQKLNRRQIYTYFRLNYCSGPETIFENVYRLMPGELISVTETKTEITRWYEPTIKNVQNEDLFSLLDDSVKLRLHADVPVCTFLSGGIDSSIISALAKKHKPDLHTFSIGFKDDPFFDETYYSELVAKHIGSSHHSIKLSGSDFLENIEPFLQSMDEPFADSSAFNFYMLSKYTAQKVKVALSGDGADELFKGYHKHKALLLKNDKTSLALATLAKAALIFAGSSRNSKAGNLKRQVEKFDRIRKLSDKDAYIALASISQHQEAAELLMETKPEYFNSLFVLKDPTFDAQTLLDLKIVLADDMLVKADRFSMRNAIEIRNPFLDYRVVEYALNLPLTEKINKHEQKIILRKTFSHLLPEEIFTRKKKGFELPLQKWLCKELREKMEGEWLNSEKISDEGILNANYIQLLQKQICSENPGDSAAKLWAIIVFENWLNKYRKFIS